MLRASTQSAAAGPQPLATYGRPRPAMRRQTTLPFRPTFLTGAICFIYLVSMGRLPELLPMLRPLRPALLATALALAYIALKPGLISRAPSLFTGTSSRVLTFFIFALVAVPFGISMGGSALFVLQFLLPVFLLWVLQVFALRRASDISVLIWGYLMACAVLCYNGLFLSSVVETFGSASMRLETSYGAMFDANDMCVVLAIGLPLCILQFQSSGRLGKFASFALLIAIAQTIARSGSRGGLLGLVAIAIMLLVMARNISVTKRVGIVAVAAIVLMLAAPQGYWEQMGTMLNPKDDYNLTSSGGRIAIWKRGMGYMAERPFFGVGLNNFGRAECTISDLVRERDDSEPNRCMAPHNSYVQAGAELGLPGLVIWCTIVFGSIITPLRLRRRLSADWSSGDAEQRFLYRMTMYLPISAFGFAVTAFFVTHAYTGMVFMVAALCAGLHACVYARVRAARAIATTAHATLAPHPGPTVRARPVAPPAR